ncbi:hypothetical protein [Methylobacterium sp. 1973]|uniref:hypothetical protein n=1 Tax=Methylobacterium sp. 1973 TaxID=3156421 RepID=UPI003392AB2F
MARLRPALTPGPGPTLRQARVAAFNAAYPVGAPILVWVGQYRDGQPVATEVEAPARCAGKTGPMVLVREHGWIALTHVFHRADPTEQRELFLDARRIEIESAELRVAPAIAEGLRLAAAARGIRAGELARRIVETITRDGLIDAVLEDGARTHRRYGEAA